MMLTGEQRAAVATDEHVMLTACPGSGKTRAAISKLLRCVDDVRGTTRRVACITYTNTAVQEIEHRLRLHSQPGDEIHYDVCTVHSFCLNHIFRPFCHLIKGYKNGFRVLTPECPEFTDHVDAICALNNRFGLQFRDYDDFVQLRMTADGTPVGQGIERGALTPAIARAYWKRIREAGFIDFANIIYWSLQLLQKRPEILEHVSAKFAWILVDEFQDTTDLQVEILSLIADKGQTKFFLVGDARQSIFSFAGSRPDLADSFAARIGARTDLQLSANFRSSPPIVVHANRLFPRTPPMTSEGNAKKFTEEPVWYHGRSPFNVVTDEFLPALANLRIPIGEAAILAPTWFSLFPLGRRLREFGVSIVGPGARPYRRNRQFAPLAEHICGYLIDPRGDALPGIERSLFHTVLDITGRAHFDILSYSGRVVVFRLLKEAERLEKTHAGAIAWLEAAAGSFAEILIEAGFFAPSEKDVFVLSVEDMKVDMRNNKVDLANLALDELGVYASPDAALKLTSLHNSKGREFAAVAMIDVHEGRMPHYYSRTPAQLEEEKRKFYVGVTRAKRFLMYITDDTGSDGASRFLSRDGVNIAKS